MMERKGYRVTGQVQGVGFRWWTREVATGLGLKGMVWNAPDGSVRMIASGPSERLRRFEQLLREGPPAAAVREVREEAAEDRPLPSGFIITR